MRNLLNDILLSSTKRYNTQRLLNMKTEELYGLPYGGSTYLSGNYSMMGFSMEFLNYKYTPEPIFNDCIDFFMDILFNPNVENGKFDEVNFNICKNNLENSIKSFSDNPRRYSNRRMRELLGEDSIISYHGDGYLEDLEKITPSNLYEYYESVLKKDLVDIFVIGDVDYDDVKKIITSKMKINTLKKKGIVISLIYMFPHRFINIIILFVLSLVSFNLSVSFFKNLLLKRTMDFKVWTGKYYKLLFASILIMFLSSVFETFLFPYLIKLITPLI